MVLTRACPSCNDGVFRQSAGTCSLQCVPLVFVLSAQTECRTITNKHTWTLQCVYTGFFLVSSCFLATSLRIRTRNQTRLSFGAPGRTFEALTLFVWEGPDSDATDHEAVERPRPSLIQLDLGRNKLTELDQISECWCPV